MTKYVGFDKATPIENKATAPDDVEAELNRLGYVWVDHKGASVLSHTNSNKVVGRVTAGKRKYTTIMKGVRNMSFGELTRAKNYVSLMTLRRLGR